MRAIPAEGERFGRYDIRQQLGRGAMGVVLSALQRDLNREVALKVMSADLVDSPEFRARFLREAATLARLDSQHVIAVYDAGQEDGRLYIATQLIPDGDLATWLRFNGPLPAAAALAIAAQVSEGLADAHRAGIVHRDIKPSNVLLRKKYDGSLHAYLCDLGIARVLEADHTNSGGAVGTYTYMAPERHQGADATEASDIYAVGCLLWAMLTGHAPFRGTDSQVLMGHLHGEVPQLDESGALDVRINDILRRSLAKLPSARYRTADRLRIGCESALRETTGHMPRSGAATSTHSRRPGEAGQTRAPSGPHKNRSGKSGAKSNEPGAPAAPQGPASSPPAGTGSAVPRAAFAANQPLLSDRPATPQSQPTPVPSSSPLVSPQSTPHLGQGGAGGVVGAAVGGFWSESSAEQAHTPDIGYGGHPPREPIAPSVSPTRGRWIAVVMVLVLVLGCGVAALLLLGGDDAGGDDDDRATPEPRITRAVDAPRDADEAAFCRVMEEGDNDTTEASREWAERAVQVGTPSDISDDARNGFEKLFGPPLEATSEAEADDRYSDLSSGDFADMFRLITYVGTTCATVSGSPSTNP